MASRTITFNVSSGQGAKIQEAMEWRVQRQSPNDVEVSLTTTEVMEQVREIALQFINSEVRSELSDKARQVVEDADQAVDDIE